MAQQGIIIPTSASPAFPGCALSCSVLLQAQYNCIPPAVPSSTQLSYDQCFCSSPFLTTLPTNADSVCVTECTIPADRQLVQSWYDGFCAKVAAGQDPTTETQTSGTTLTTTATLSQQTAGATLTGSSLTGTATPTPGVNSSTSSSTQQNQTWIQGHWKYVLMLAILIVGLGLLAWLAVWLKKRHRRKVEAKRAAASGFNYDPEKRPKVGRQSPGPELWGPHQMMQATQGYGYSSEFIDDKTKRGESQKYRGADTRRLTKEAIEVVDSEAGVATRPSTRRARPSELEINARMIGAADRRSKSRGKSSRGTDKDRDESPPELPRSKSLRKKQRDTEKT